MADKKQTHVNKESDREIEGRVTRTRHANINKTDIRSLGVSQSRTLQNFYVFADKEDLEAFPACR